MDDDVEVFHLGNDNASSSEHSASEDEGLAWGRTKRAYYDADHASDISDDEEEERVAKMEEEEARRLQQEQLNRLAETDFMDESEWAGTLGHAVVHGYATGPGLVGSDIQDEQQLETLSKDATEAEKLAWIQRNAPELPGLVEDLDERQSMFESDIQPLIKSYGSHCIFLSLFENRLGKAIGSFGQPPDTIQPVVSILLLQFSKSHYYLCTTLIQGRAHFRISFTYLPISEFSCATSEIHVVSSSCGKFA